MAKSHRFVPFAYDDEPFFKAYDALYKLWAKSSNKDILYMFDSSEGGMLNCDINNPYECKKVE